MITQFIITMVLGIVQGLVGLLPAWTVDDSSVTSMAGWGSIGGSANGYVPENELLICIGLILAVRLFYLAWDGLLFVYHLIPFNG